MKDLENNDKARITYRSDLLNYRVVIEDVFTSDDLEKSTTFDEMLKRFEEFLQIDIEYSYGVTITLSKAYRISLCLSCNGETTFYLGNCENLQRVCSLGCLDKLINEGILSKIGYINQFRS